MKNRQSIRLKNYDYSQSGFYYVTICNQNRKCLFGDVVNGKMILNEFGKIIKSVWQSLPKRFPIVLDVFQIMPNHIHMIIHIVGAGSSRPIKGSSRPITGSSRPTLGQIIGYFKYQSTKQINNIWLDNPTNGLDNPTPTGKIQKIFQRNYYEHIIRTETNLNKIRQYIKTNPKIWDRDQNNPKYQNE